jgi:hypothetical protein
MWVHAANAIKRGHGWRGRKGRLIQSGGLASGKQEGAVWWRSARTGQAPCKGL